MSETTDDKVMEPFLYRGFKHALYGCKGFGELAEPGSIGFCVGPGGAGKTLLSKAIGPLLYGHSDKWPVGRKPYIRIEADIPDRGYFSSKDLIRSLLCAIHDPFRTKIPEMLAWDVPDIIKYRLITALEKVNPHKSHEPDMRVAFINLARELGVKLIIIDEANLLVLTQNGRVPTDYLESLRRLGDQIGCSILLFGTFDLLELMSYSAQLNRRTFRIHLERFRCDDKVGLGEFLDFLHGVEVDHGLSEGALTPNAAAIYAATYGIAGEVVGLVQRAQVVRIGYEESSVKWEHIKLAMHHKSAVDQLRLEADLIHNVMNGIPLSLPQKEASSRRMNNRMKARRVSVGSAPRQ